MRVLMTTSSTSLMDGINRHILAMAPALNRLADMEVAVVTLHQSGELNAALEAKGVRTFSMRAPHGHYLPVLWRFLKVMRSYRPDIVHLHVRALFEMIVLHIFFSWQKCVETAHGISDPIEVETSPFGYSFKRSFGQFFRRIINRISEVKIAAVCYISKGVRDYYLKGRVYGHIAEVIYNPVVSEDFPRARKKLRQLLGIPEETKIVGTACRIASVKNPQAFTRVMCQVLKQCTKAHAVVVGSGEDSILAELASIVESHHVADRFHFLGYREDAKELVAGMDCFVMTSQREGMPGALLEAMSVKTPVAFWEGEGGLTDLADLNRAHGPFATVSEKGDEQALSRGIVSLFRIGDNLNRAEIACSLVRERFCVDTIVLSLRGVYLSVVTAV